MNTLVTPELKTHHYVFFSRNTKYGSRGDKKMCPDTLFVFCSSKKINKCEGKLIIIVALQNTSNSCKTLISIMVTPLQKCASFSEEETAEPIAAVPEPPVNSCRQGERNLFYHFCDTIIA